MPTRNTYNVIIAFVGVALLLGGLTAAYQQSGYQHHVTDDPLTVDYETPSELDAPDYAFNYSESVNITVDGTALSAGEDYEYNASAGRVAWVNSSATSSGDTALADYAYAAPSEQTHTVSGLLSSLGGIVPYAALALGVAATIKLADGGW